MRKPVLQSWALFSITILSLLCYLAACDLRSQASEPDTRPVQWRVIWKDHPAHQATISWSTARRGKLHRVLVTSGNGDEARVVECHRNGPYTGGNAFYHHARLADLQPSTRYDIVLESDGQRSPKMYFVTAPDDDRPIHLLFGGDSRSGRQARQQINRMMAQMATRDPSIIAFAHGGDYVVTGHRFDLWDAWLSDHELTVTADGRLVPIIPARGNHDSGKLFDEVFDFPVGDTNYYALNLTAQVRLITLNTNISAGGDQAQWLADELQRSRPRHRWLLAQYHRPAFPAVKIPGAARRHWVPLFEQYHLDLACESDGHVIKRTSPIRNEKFDPTGVVYIGEGGLGVTQRTPDVKRWYLQPPGVVGRGHHVQLLQFSPTGLRCQTILHGGQVFDDVTLKPRERSQPPLTRK